MKNCYSFIDCEMSSEKCEMSEFGSSPLQSFGNSCCREGDGYGVRGIERDMATCIQGGSLEDYRQ